ncbi:phage tail protein [Tenacibaculum sp. TC6]|uniref:phage tail protein n=1 Tax=Tenacibaculum sp. TC6 TaxID=3423223 RepID=UPI003D363C7B
MANSKKAKEESEVGKFPVGFYFSVSFDGSEGLPFQQVSGLTKEQTVEEVAGGGENRFKYRLPAVSVSKNLVLKRALVPKGDLLTKWCKESIDGGLAKPIQTKTISVNLLNKQGQASMKWNFYKAYPIKYSISDLKSQESEVLIDTIEFAYIHFTVS